MRKAMKTTEVMWQHMDRDPERDGDYLVWTEGEITTAYFCISVRTGEPVWSPSLCVCNNFCCDNSHPPFFSKFPTHWAEKPEFNEPLTWENLF